MVNIYIVIENGPVKIEEFSPWKMVDLFRAKRFLEGTRLKTTNVGLSMHLREKTCPLNKKNGKYHRMCFDIVKSTASSVSQT